MLDEVPRGADYLDQIVRGHVGGHTDGDATCAIDKKVGECGRKDVRLQELVVVVRDEIDDVFIKPVGQREGSCVESRLCVSRGRRSVVKRSEVSMSIDERYSQCPRLCEADEGIVDRGVTVGVEFSHDLTDNSCRLNMATVRPETHFRHLIKDASLHRFQPVAGIRKCPRIDNRVGIFKERSLHLGRDVNVFDPLSDVVLGYVRVFSGHSWLLELLTVRKMELGQPYDRLAPMPTMLPTFQSSARSLADVLPDSLAALRGESTTLGLQAVDAVVVIVVDGLGAANLRERSGHARFLAANSAKPLQSTAPSTTAAALTTILTGSLPGQHGLTGYRVFDAKNDRVVNQLTGWDERMPPATWQRSRTVFEMASDAGIGSHAIGPVKYAGTGFTAAVLRGATYHGEDRIEARLAAASDIVNDGGPSLSYVYVPELDKIAHQYGWESDRWTGALETVDAEIRRFAERLPGGVGVIVCADHGVVDVPHRAQILFDTAQQLTRGVRHVGGEPRFLQLYLEPDASDRDREKLLDAWRDSEGSRAWVASRGEAIAAGWFGDVDVAVADRIGDILVAARKRVVYYDSRPEDQSARRMIGQHGSLTAEELQVPFVRLGAWSNR